MDLETARAVVAAGDAEFGRAFQEMCDWQYRAFERLRDAGAISKEGFDRMVAVPDGQIVVDGGRGGPWIGVRTLTDREVIDSGAVANYVLREACDAQPLMMGDVFYPFLAPGVSNILAAFRANLRRNLGWFGRLLCATLLGRYIYPRAPVVLAALAAVLDSPRHEAEGKVRRRDCQAHILGTAVPYRVETWIIGKDVRQETYDNFKDQNGQLYVIERFRDEKQEMSVVAKPQWEKHRRDMLAKPMPSTIEEYFDYYHKALLACDFEAQAFAAVTMNTLWRAFNANYPDLESFRDASESEQIDYLRKVGEMIEQMTSGQFMGKSTPEGASLGPLLVQLYLTAVARNNVEMVKRIAAALEPFNKIASDVLEAARGTPPLGGS